MYFYSLLQSTSTHENISKIGEPSLHDDYSARAALRGKMQKLEEKLVKYKVNPVYRHLQSLDCAVPSGSVMRGRIV